MFLCTSQTVFAKCQASQTTAKFYSTATFTVFCRDANVIAGFVYQSDCFLLSLSFVLTSVFLFCILNKKLKVPLHLTCLYSRLKSLVHSLTPKLSQSAVSGEKTRQCPGGAVLQCCVTARCWAVMPSQSVSTISDNWLSLLRITSLLLRTRPETTAAADHSFSI